nr:hypothetical protein [Tanacetum cinerariifolium]
MDARWKIATAINFSYFSEKYRFSYHMFSIFISLEHAPLSPAYALSYIALTDDNLEPAEAQALPTHVLPAPLSPGNLKDSELIENDPQEAQEDPKEVPSKEEEELSASVASTPDIAGLASQSEETKPFEEDEARKLVHPQTPLPSSFDAHIHAWRTAPTPPSPSPSPLSPLSSPLPMIPSPPLPPSPIRRDTIPEVDLPPQKSARLSFSPYRFEIRKSSAATATRQLVSTLARGTRYGFVAALEEANERVTDLATDHRQEIHIIHQRQDDVNRMTRVVGRVRELECARKPECQDGLPDAGSDYVTNQNSGNGNDNGNGSHDLGGDSGRTSHTARYATCTFLGGALTWWNFHVGTAQHDAAFGMPWKALIKIMTEAYCLRSEIKKLETELWNLIVKVERYVRGLSDNIQGSVMASKLKILQEAIEFARSLTDQKVLVYAARQAVKRRMDNNPRSNLVQQPPYKRQNVARAYTTRPGEMREYAGTLPLCNKRKFHHTRSRVAKRTNCQRVGHFARDWHYKSDCSKLKNKNRRNQSGNDEAHGRAYALGGGKANPDLNVFTGDKVILKVSPWKGVICFGKHGKLNSRIHITFLVSNLKKYLFDESLVIPLDEILRVTFQITRGNYGPRGHTVKAKPHSYCQGSMEL